VERHTPEPTIKTLPSGSSTRTTAAAAAAHGTNGSSSTVRQTLLDRVTLAELGLWTETLSYAASTRFVEYATSEMTVVTAATAVAETAATPV
jgi:hypothetical protein